MASMEATQAPGSFINVVRAQALRDSSMNVYSTMNVVMAAVVETSLSPIVLGHARLMSWIFEQHLFLAQGLQSSFNRNSNASESWAGVDLDLEWFYSDRRRVESYQGQYVAIVNKRVVGSGTSASASAAANDALVIYVETPREQVEAKLGL